MSGSGSGSSSSISSSSSSSSSSSYSSYSSYSIACRLPMYLRRQLGSGGCEKVADQ